MERFGSEDGQERIGVGYAKHDNAAQRYDTSIVLFFQAEDGIRDVAVTGVQTCALPISIHSRGVSAAIHESSVARAALRRTPRCDDRGTAGALRRNEPCSCGRFSPECRRPDNISDRTTGSAPERRGFSAIRLLHPGDGEKHWEAAGEAAIAFPRPKKFRSSIRERGSAPAGCPPRIASACIRS